MYFNNLLMQVSFARDLHPGVLRLFLALSSQINSDQFEDYIGCQGLNLGEPYARKMP